MAEDTKRFDMVPGMVIVLIAAISGGAVWWWAENRHRFFPKRWGEVVPGTVYRSGQLHRDLVEDTLREHGIDVIISLRPCEMENPDHLAEREVAGRLNIELIELDLAGDGTGDLEHFVKAVEAMHQARQSNEQVLVHCAAGAYRTGGAVAFYRLLVEEVPPESIRGELGDYGWRDKERLIPYLNDHMADMARRLKEQGIIEQVPQPVPVIPSG